MSANPGTAPAPLLARGCALLVACLAGWPVRAVIGFDFVEFDDGINIVFNPHLGPWSWDTVKWALTDMDQMRRYVPLGWLGFSAVYTVSGLEPAGYHGAGLALHVLNSVLVFAVVLAVGRRFAPTADDRWRAVWATLAALAWSWHPLRAETVGWASGLLYGISGAAALGSVLAYLRAGESGVARTRWVIVAAVLHLAGMLAYPMSLGLVVVFVALDLAMRPGRQDLSWRALAWEKAWFVVPTLAVLALTLRASHEAPAYWVRPPAWGDFGPGQRILQAASAWAYFLWRPFWPVELTPVPTPFFDPTTMRGTGLASLAAVAAGSAILLGGGPRLRSAALGWFTYAGVLVPMLGFFEQPYFPSDRYHYLPGVVMVAALALAAAGAGRGLRLPLVAAGLAGVVLLGVRQRDQLRIWADTDALMERIVAKADHAVVRRNYEERWLNFHRQRGNESEAARVAARLGRRAPSAERPASGAVPAIARLHCGLGLDFGRAGRGVEARAHLEAALRLAPDWNEAAYNLSLVHALHGEPAEALRWYGRATAPGRGDPVPLVNRQRLLLLMADGFARRGRMEAARQAIERALREGGGAGADDALERELRTRRERWPGPEKR